MRAAPLALAIAAAPLLAAADPAPTAFERGVARFQRGDYAGAIGPLAEARAASPNDADTVLLLGISYYQLGNVDEAAPLLAQAERDGDDDAKASARVFLGLIADRRGEPARARSYYALVARSSSELGASGRLLLEQGGPERWSLLAILALGYDSNVALQSMTATAPGPGRRGASAGDGELSMIVTATARPVPCWGLVLDDAFAYRAYAQQTGYNLLANAVGGAYTVAGTHDRASVAYHFDASTLGGARYELAHLADVGYRHVLGNGIGLGARYTLAHRDYAPDAYVGYTGFDHLAGVELAWGSPRAPSEGWVGYVVEREATSDATLASIGHGARGEVSARLSGDTQLRATALALYRSYDAAAMGRVDTLVRGDVAGYVGVGGAFGVVAGIALARNVSNAADFDYTKWTVYVGVVAAASPN